MSDDGRREPVPHLPLFVPATRAERIARAAASGADAVIVDLEDAVAEGGKDTARKGLRDVLGDDSFPVPVLVRINAYGTRHFEADLAQVATLRIAGIVLPKADGAVRLGAIRDRLGTGSVVVALVETARGLADARALARNADRLAFGSIDFAGDIGAAHRREALLAARSELVLAAALASAPPPLDGVTTRVDDEAQVEEDARYAASLGFGGKLLIHPAQIVPAIRGFAPQAAEVERAREVLADGDGDASRSGGEMVDRPVLAAARRRIEVYELAQQRIAKIQGAGK